MGQWRNRLGGIVHSGSTMRTLLLRTRLKQQAKNGRKVVHEVESADQAADLKLWEQGNLSWYSDDMLEARSALRESQGVIAELQLWWTTTIDEAPGKESKDAIASKAAYLKAMSKLYKVMIEAGEYDAEEARDCAEEDYERDLNGSTEMTRTLFCNAIFELADCALGSPIKPGLGPALPHSALRSCLVSHSSSRSMGAVGRRTRLCHLPSCLARRHCVTHRRDQWSTPVEE